MATKITPGLVSLAYQALATGDRENIRQYWADDMVWEVPGHNQLSGWKYNLDDFLAFMQKVGELSGGSFHMDPITILCNEEYSCDVTHNAGSRAGNAEKELSIEVAHVLRWRDGKVIAGRGGIFGDGTARYDDFWYGPDDDRREQAHGQWAG
jgi:ketosteroid isomerase-like protein